MRSLLLALLALALASGCLPAESDCSGTETDGTMCPERLTAELTLSSTFDAEQQDRIMAASRAWGSATDGRVAITWRIVDGQADVFPSTTLPAGLVGGTTRRGRIALSPALHAGEMWQNALHEFGHTFGMGHDSTERTCMHTGVYPWGISPADVEHFDRLWAEAH